MHSKIKRLYHNKQILSLIACCFIAIFSILVRYPAPNTYSYKNSDATYHVLLTLHAYDETPASVHKYLPIVSLRAPDDKNIPWGATIPDEKGNYYYTSFSSANFFLPYIFIKGFHLPINEQSLYLFNSLIMLLTLIATVFLFQKIFKNKFSLVMINCFVTILYLFQFEVMHSQGITYWVQSVFQLLFVLQVLCFLERKNSKFSLYMFWLLCLVNPYTEWTGYVSNFGFMVAILIENYICDFKKQRKLIHSIKEISIIIVLTLSAFTLFCIHFISVCNSTVFFEALKTRFFARSISNPSSIVMLLKGYLDSFGYLLILIVLLLMVCLFYKSSRKKLFNSFRSQLSLIAIFSIPLVENILMKEHATVYSFDRLKGIFILIFLFLTILYSLKDVNKLKHLQICLLFAVIIISSIQLYVYAGTNNRWRWKAEYLKDNVMFADYMKKYDKSSVFGQSGIVRGYTNLLFQRGVYEAVSPDFLLEKSKEEKKRFAVYLETKESSYTDAIIYDNEKGLYKKVVYNKDKKKMLETHIDTISLSKLTDKNWTNGVSNFEKKLLFDATAYNKAVLSNAKAFQINGSRIVISSIVENGPYINVVLAPQEDITVFMHLSDEIKVLYK